METTIGDKAAIPNPVLRPFEALIGAWHTTGSHPLLPGAVLHGRVAFEWFAGGAFVLMRTEVDEPRIPDGIALFGSDDAASQLVMLYFDERGVSRTYAVTIAAQRLHWWRDDPGFSQRFTITLDAGGDRMHGTGEMSRDGAAWEDDLELTYTRINEPPTSA
jgi:hypothetical protein